MEENPEKRDNARIDHQCLVTIENLKAGTINKAKMLNFSATGLYFEADNLLQPGEEVFVGIDNSPFASEQGLYECYRVEIVWRKELKKSAYYYGYGAKHTIDHHKVNLEEGETREWHGRTSAGINEGPILNPFNWPPTIAFLTGSLRISVLPVAL